MLGLALVVATIVLLLLKITGVIAVSWLLVLTPVLVLLILWALILFCLAITGAAMLTMILSAFTKR